MCIKTSSTLHNIKLFAPVLVLFKGKLVQKPETTQSAEKIQFSRLFINI